MFFQLNTWVLTVVLIAIVGGFVAAGIIAGRAIRARTESHRESVGVVQGTLLGLVGLLLALGVTMAVGRYEARRNLVVEEANDIGTSYLRAQLLPEPVRTESLDLLRQYADAAIDLADEVPDSAAFDADVESMAELQRALWATAGAAVAADDRGVVSRLYVESLNRTIDVHASRVASLRNRVPSTVVILQVIGGSMALGASALYLTLLGRGIGTPLAAAFVVLLILLISLDLDRPQRGFITVPYAPLADVRDSMNEPPAAMGP